MIKMWCVSVVCLSLLIGWSVGQQNFNPRPRSERPPQEVPLGVLPRSLTPDAVRDAFARARDSVQSRRSGLVSRNRPMNPVTDMSSARHQMLLAGRSRSKTLENVQEQFEEATRILLTEFNLTPQQILAGLSNQDLQSMLQGNMVQNCTNQFNFQCQANSRFRTFDGTCNNLEHSSWGMAASCFERLVPPAYGDGAADKRVAQSGGPLPEPRRISLEIHNHLENPTDYVTHLHMAYGQFLDHDITLTPVSSGPNNTLLECCPVNDQDPAECDPIIVQEDDPFFGTFGITCLNNVRSAMCSTCTLGAREQTNQVTAYIDASHIYGTSQNDANRLRTNDGTGTLRSVNTRRGGELMPPSPIPNDDQCSFQDRNLDCFDAGDQRVNQHPALTSLHTLFLREHNRIARRLREINRNWDGERIYQEARRIVGAIQQMITYNEFLPLVIGPERMEWFDLSVKRSGFTRYDPTVQATLVNEFSTGAFRFGHSMINSFFPQFSRAANSGNRLREVFVFPFGLYNGELDGIVNGLTQSPAQKFDRHVVRDVTNHLYQARNDTNGLDLASLNINRGRDHGIPGYTTLVEYCGGPTITSFSQLDRLFQRGLRQLFQNIYEDVRDIDLWSGGLAERPNQGAIVGPTFTCIMGIQFYHLKYGDRFYFEHGEQTGSFTPTQLREIRKITLGKVMCQNSNVANIQPNVMLFPSRRNPERSCEELPEMDLNAWRERCPLAVFLLLSVGLLPLVVRSLLLILPQLEKDVFGKLVDLPDLLTVDSIEEAFEEASQEETRKEKGISNRRSQISLFQQEGLAGSRHLTFLSGGARSNMLEKFQMFFEETAKILQIRFHLNRNQVLSGLSRIDLSKLAKRKELNRCRDLFQIPCESTYPYRTMDGSCNNLRHPSWGMAESCHDRFVPPDYADGLSERRKSKTGRPLPLPRTVSNVIHSHLTQPNQRATHMLMLWGQLIAHDISLTPVSKEPSESCCPAREQNHPECSPIIISKNDPFYRKFGITCLPNIRSAACCTCDLGPREQINQQTAFIDVSMIYGTNLNQSRSLRNLDGTGTLRFSSTEMGGELLPSARNSDKDFCSFQHPEFNCFVTGDRRVNQHAPLTAMHVILLREHNRLARRLKRINPSWGEERLFQEARRIVIAETQMITYNEYLPLLLGQEVLRRHKLFVRPSGRTAYSPTLPARIAIEFSSAAFRAGHSMVHGLFAEASSGGDMSGGGHLLRDIFMYPFPLYTGHLEGMVAGFFSSSVESADRHIIKDLTNHLYQAAGNDSGLDLAAINVNRGRDNGIPGYTTHLEFCGGPKVESWSELDQIFMPGLRSLFKKVYEHVQDIDLFSGGLAERPVPGGAVGPTFACIIAKQFARIKFGDRFYFEHRRQMGSFTTDQVQEIKLTTLAKLICRNSKIENAQPNVFLFPSEENPQVSCNDYPTLDLTYWEEKLNNFRV